MQSKGSQTPKAVFYTIPVMWHSGRDETTGQKIHQWLQELGVSVEADFKGDKEILGVIRLFYNDYGGAYTTVCICQNSE